MSDDRWMFPVASGGGGAASAAALEFAALRLYFLSVRPKGNFPDVVGRTFGITLPACLKTVEVRTVSILIEMQEIINEKPDNFLPWAIVSTVLCCLPFGIVAIVYASKVDTLWYAQKQAEAVHAAKQARTWTFVSIGTGLFFVLMYIFFMGTVLSLGLNM